jgi:xanthine dehydrogenase iron-sulfur cluster and FAD-binding subunit A
MKHFNYARAETVAEACELLAEHGSGATLLAGGTDLLISLRAASKRPKLLIDISGLGELEGVSESDGTLSLRPLTTHSGLLRSGTLQSGAPLLVSAASSIGSPQIRARGTVGGNIMNAAACADTVPPLIALGARVTLQSRTGSRELALADLFLKPYQTKADPDELLTDIRFPKLSANTRSAFIKLGRRNALAISRLSVAAILEFGEDGRIADARLVAGAAFPTWRRVGAAERMLVGEKPSPKLFAAAGQKVSVEMIKETGRRWSTEYKEPVLAVLVRRALEQCASPAARSAAVPATAVRTGWVPAKSGKSRNGSGGLSNAPAVSTTINGRAYTFAVQANQTLLEVLREQLGLAGTKCGCEIGECGACTVLLDGDPVNACLVLAPQIHGRAVVTVEGLGQNGTLHPLQASFLDHDAVQCGFCTPGMLMSAKALLNWNPRPTEKEIRTAISGNLCRCTGYQQIVKAIGTAFHPPQPG